MKKVVDTKKVFIIVSRTIVGGIVKCRFFSLVFKINLIVQKNQIFQGSWVQVPWVKES